MAISRLAAVVLPAAVAAGTLTGIASRHDEPARAAASRHHGSVTIISTATNRVRATVRIGGLPSQIVVTPDGKTAYVLDSFSYAVTRITAGSAISASRVRAGRFPIGIAMTPNGRTIYITRQSSTLTDSVLPVNARTGRPARPINVPADSPGGDIAGPITVVPNGTVALAAEDLAGGGDRDALLPIRTSRNTQGKVILFSGDGFGVGPMVVSPDSRTVYVLSFDYSGSHGSLLTPIGVGSRKVHKSLRITPTIGPMAMTPNGRFIYITDSYDNVVTVVRASTNRIVRRIRIYGPTSLAISPNGKTVFVAGSDPVTGAAVITPIRVATNMAGTPLALPGDGAIDAMAVTPNGRTLYLADYSFAVVVPISTATMSPGAPIRVGPFPEALAITKDGSMIYVVNSDAA